MCLKHGIDVPREGALPRRVIPREGALATRFPAAIKSGTGEGLTGTRPCKLSAHSPQVTMGGRRGAQGRRAAPPIPTPGSKGSLPKALPGTIRLARVRFARTRTAEYPNPTTKDELAAHPAATERQQRHAATEAGEGRRTLRSSITDP